MTHDPLGGPLADILAHIPIPDAAKSDLRARLADPARSYHGTGHIALLWHRHRHYGTGLSVQQEPWNTLLACAIAFHDAIYDAARRDNETRSATLWQNAAPALPPDAIAWVAQTILATANHLAATPEPDMPPDSWTARAWMLDLDLTPLGEDPATFDTNTEALRHEFRHLSDEAWTKGRATFLHAIAATPRLFRTPILHDAFEAPARANFARSAGSN